MVKELWNKLLNVLNVHPDGNQKWLLISMCITSLLFTYTSPTFTKAIISALPAQWIAFESLFSSIVGLFVGMIWKGSFRRNIIKYFIIFCISESACGLGLAMFLCFVKWNVWVYAIASLIFSNFISLLIGKAIMAFRARMWNDKEKEIYDNNNSIVSGICCIIGFAFALFALPDLKICLFLWGIACIFDNIGWIIVYIKNEEGLHGIENEDLF